MTTIAATPPAPTLADAAPPKAGAGGGDGFTPIFAALLTPESTLATGTTAPPDPGNPLPPAGKPLPTGGEVALPPIAIAASAVDPLPVSVDEPPPALSVTAIIAAVAAAPAIASDGKQPPQCPPPAEAIGATRARVEAPRPARFAPEGTAETSPRAGAVNDAVDIVDAGDPRAEPDTIPSDPSAARLDPVTTPLQAGIAQPPTGAPLPTAGVSRLHPGDAFHPREGGGPDSAPSADPIGTRRSPKVPQPATSQPAGATPLGPTTAISRRNAQSATAPHSPASAHTVSTLSSVRTRVPASLAGEARPTPEKVTPRRAQEPDAASSSAPGDEIADTETDLTVSADATTFVVAGSAPTHDLPITSPEVTPVAFPTASAPTRPTRPRRIEANPRIAGIASAGVAVAPRPDAVQPNAVAARGAITPTTAPIPHLQNEGRGPVAQVTEAGPSAGTAPRPVPTAGAAPSPTAVVAATEASAPASPEPSRAALDPVVDQVSARPTASPATQPAPEATPPQPATLPIPAAESFGAALHRAVVAERRPRRDADLQAIAAPANTPSLVPVATTPIDTARADWPATMVSRIEALREQLTAPGTAADTRIRLHPDALGTVDVTLRQDATGTHVRLAAAEPAARALLADAQPQLQSLADQRGLRLAGADVGGGNAQAGQGWRDDRRQPAPATPARPAPANDTQADDPADTRLA